MKMRIANGLRRASLVIILVLAVGAVSSGRAGESLAQVHTPLGELLMVLCDSDKPVTVANFKQYIASGRFRDSFVQRWEPGFVIQGGGFYVTNRCGSNPLIDYVPTFGKITNEYSVGRTLSNTYGTIAMARVGGQTNSATSQWFINLADNVSLDTVDGGFTVFGRVMLGAHVLNRFNITTQTNCIWRVAVGGQASLQKLPVLSPSPTMADLVYCDFSLPVWPRVQIAVDGDGRRRLSWSSLSNFVHHLEFSSSAQAAWQTLLSTNGTGQVIESVDERPNAGGGYYRVRIE